MRSDPDTPLIEACQEALRHAAALGPGAGSPGLEGPFRELYDRYKDRVYNVCFRISGNGADALDASQETFGILFRKLTEFRGQARLSSWIYRIAINASIDLRRRSRSRRLPSLEALRDRRSGGDDVGGFDLEDESLESPPAAAARHELEDEIHQAIGRLSPKLRGITVLRYSEGLSYEEIAETLQISIGTVKSRLARAHAGLDRELTPVLDRYYLGEENAGGPS
jgi:RNA polymerase sigma-70 factor (ECF subfamily)